MSASSQSDLIRLLESRGYIHQATDLQGLDDLAAQGRITGYIGFDCTASSLHVGNLVSVMLLRRLQQTGHKPIVVLGGGTTKIGDPSGKDEARRLLSDADIDANKTSLAKIFERFLDFGDSSTGAVFVDNAEWLDELDYVPFLREIGRHFSINRMLGFDSVRLRLEREQPLSFLEFNYMILQAYDFLELNRRMDCRLQFGGSDQWGNIVNGVELIRRIRGSEAFGLTTPLITTADGAKMGKTAGGAVWLNEAALPSYDYWQFWRNTHDADVGRFLRLFTDVPLEEIEKLEALEGAEINEAKKRLADEATALCRGRAAADAASATASAIFENGRIGSELPSLNVTGGSIGLIDALTGLGFASSRGEARRLIRQGGAKVDGSVVKEEDHEVIVSSGSVQLSAGKKHHGVLNAA